jgi:hypothetical protein
LNSQKKDKEVKLVKYKAALLEAAAVDCSALIGTAADVSQQA